MLQRREASNVENQGLFSGKRPTCFVSLAVTALLIVAAVLYYLDATTAKNFNGAEMGFILGGAVCAAAFALVPNKFFDMLNLVAVGLVAAAFATLFINSINTFADVLSGITMFASTGGIDWIIRLAVILGIALVAEVVSCFMSRDAK